MSWIIGFMDQKRDILTENPLDEILKHVENDARLTISLKCSRPNVIGGDAIISSKWGVYSNRVPVADISRCFVPGEVVK